MTHRIALVSTAEARPLDEDLEPLVSALQFAGARVEVANWDDAGVAWSRFDLAVLRSPWNYAQHVDAFVAWLDATAHQTRLVNPPAIVRWNLDKHYLAQLAQAGVATVPGAFVEPGTDVAMALTAFLDAHDDASELVVKPAIGAGSRDVQRHARNAGDDTQIHMRRLLDAGRSVLLQPYLERVDMQGETALVHLDGLFSHAIRKGPLLKRGADSTRALFAEEQITPRVPSPAELELAGKALAAIPHPHALAYARVDLLEDSDGSPRLLELELAEPSLFFAHADGAADRFAATLLRHADGQ